jgi:Transposase DDE domain
MYLRTSKQRLKDGSLVEHYQLAESTWDRQKKRSRTQIVYNFGRVDDPAVAQRLRKLAHSILRRCAPEEIVAEAPGWRLVDAWPYGDLYVLETLWRRLGLDAIVAECAQSRKLRFGIERAIFSMVANRAVAPCSKLYCYEQWLREDVRIEGTEDLELQHLYRAMDFLEANRERIEEATYFRLANLFELDVDLIFYDTTSLHFEVDEEDVGAGPNDEVGGSRAAGAKRYKAPRKRGYSKNGRGDAPQIVVGLAVTRDGLPVRHWVFPGNTVDVTTVAKVKEDLRGWKLSRCVFVGDAGMVSAANLRTLSLGGGKYIVCMPMTQGSEVGQEVLTRPGRYSDVAGNLRVKEVIVGDGERRRRYVVCHNPEEVRRQRKHRARLLRELEAELIAVEALDSSAYSKRVFELVASRRYGRYVRRTKTGKLRLDRAAVRAAQKLDGKFVVHSNDDTLSAEDLALGYKQLMRVEEAWRQLKSGLRMRPVFHYVPHRIHAHVFLTVLALLLERIAEQACGDTWRNIRDDLKQIKLAQLAGPDGTIWQVTEARPEARNRMKSLRIPNPPTILAHA